MPENWIVLVEAAATDAVSSRIEPHQVRTLLAALDPGVHGSALQSPDRYALQLIASGSGPGEAVADVLSRWASAVRQLDLPPFEVVRVEVFKPEEFEREVRDPAAEGTSVARFPASGRRPDDDDDIVD